MSAAFANGPQRVAVVGGGITGLAAAHRLRELSPATKVTLYEAQSRLGGVIRTERRGGFLLEHSADMLTTRDPWGVSLCDRLGLSDELLGTNEAHRRAFVVRRGKLLPVPAGFTLMSPARIWPIVTTKILSPWGKLRLGWEYFVPPRAQERDESLAEFTKRRLGLEAFERLVQPLISGMYTADPHRLSMRAAMSQFVEMESQHGSLIRGMRRTVQQKSSESGSGARYGMFVAPRAGMGQLIEALEARLPAKCIQLQDAVSQLTREAHGWTITSPRAGTQRFDAVILATRAHDSAHLLRSVHGRLAAELAEIPYASAAVLIAGYRRDQIAHPLDGFGAVVPLCERRNVLSISFSSVKFAGRAPDGQVLLRVFVGGACQAELLEHADDDLQRLVFVELQELLGLRGSPLFCQLVRWPQAMPQYHLGHLERVARIDQFVASIPRLALAGNAYHGIGVPFCVRSGELAAERIAAPPIA